MPYSISAPTNLVQVAFDAYNAPIQSTILQEDATIKKQEIVSNQLALQNQVALQQDMTKIWGSGGLSSVDPNDPSSAPKLMATAQSLFAHGQAQAGSQFLSALSMLSYRQAQTQKDYQQTQYRNFEEVGSALGSVTDQASEDAALARIKALGFNPAQYGITGDFSQDGPRLPQLAQMSMSRAQQVLAADRTQREADLETQRGVQNGFAAQRLDQASKRIDVQNAMLDLRRHQQVDNEKEADRRDSRFQEGLHFKELQAEDRTYANASKVQGPEKTVAEGIFATDDRTSGLDPNTQKALANVAALRAKRQIAQQMVQSGDAEYEPEDYAQALADQMDQMAREGMFQGGSGGWFGPKTPNDFKPGPPANAPAPAKKEQTQLEKMAADPRAVAIKNNPSMSLEEKKAALAKLGY